MRHNQRMIFRQKAWEAYVGKQEQAVLPRLVTPPVFVFCWILFAFLLSAGSIAWWEQVPIYASGLGIVLEQSTASRSASHEMVALIFVPASHPLSVQQGASIQLQFDKTGPGSSGHIERVEPGLISPQEARRRYQLTGTAALLITSPSMVVLVRLAPPLSQQLYAGSLVSTQVPIGTQPLLALLFASSK